MICYRGRSAIRDVGKVFGLSEDTLVAARRHALGLVDGRRARRRRPGAPASIRPIRGCSRSMELAEELMAISAPSLAACRRLCDHALAAR